MAHNRFALVLIAVMLHLVPCKIHGDDGLKLLAMVSVPEPGTRASQDWEKGEETLPGAQSAVEEINKYSGLLPGYRLELTEIITVGCNPNLALVQFVQHITKEDEHIVGVVGPFCNSVTRLIALVMGHRNLGLIQLAAATSPIFRDKIKYPNLFRMLPLSGPYVETVFGLMRQFKWRRIGVLCGFSQENYYCRTAEDFILAASSQDVEIVHYNELMPTNMPAHYVTLKQLQYSGANIVLALLPPIAASEVICAAYHQDLIWPKYAWIFPDRNLKDFHLTTKCNSCAVMTATEGLILLKPHLETNELRNASFDNPFANVLYESVWAFAAALNKSIPSLQAVNLSLTTTNMSLTALINFSVTQIIANELSMLDFGHIKFNNNNDAAINIIDIIQVNNGTTVHVGSYDVIHRKIYESRELLSKLPNDELQRIYQIFPTALTVILSTITVLCLILTTVIMILFIGYRRQPEIKATSCQLSLFIFLGCYLLLIGTLSHTIDSGMIVRGTAARKTICNITVWNCSIGFNLVLTTLFARILRIYRIFTHFGKTGKVCSDGVLVVLILTVTSGIVLVLTFWVATDTFYLEDYESYEPDSKPPHYEVFQRCHSDHMGVWLFVLFVYTGVNFLSLLFLAYKTRKIRRENFKDTKKVNALIFLTVMIICIVIPLWVILRTIRDTTISKVVLAVGYGLVAVVVQLFLFVPKTIPPFIRHIKTKFSPMCTVCR